jgi:hypothetical protein
MPSVLCEIGFLNHPADGAYITSQDGQQQIVEALLKSIATYLGVPVDFKPAPTEVTWGVQIKATQDPILQTFPLDFEVRRHYDPSDRYWRYYVEAASEKQATDLLQHLQTKGYKDAFRVRFKNGERIK